MAPRNSSRNSDPDSQSSRLFSSSSCPLRFLPWKAFFIARRLRSFIPFSTRIELFRKESVFRRDVSSSLCVIGAEKNEYLVYIATLACRWNWLVGAAFYLRIWRKRLNYADLYSLLNVSSPLPTSLPPSLPCYLALSLATSLPRFPPPSLVPSYSRKTRALSLSLSLSLSLPLSGPSAL